MKPFCSKHQTTNAYFILKQTIDQNVRVDIKILRFVHVEFEVNWTFWTIHYVVYFLDKDRDRYENITNLRCEILSIAYHVQSKSYAMWIPWDTDASTFTDDLGLKTDKKAVEWNQLTDEKQIAIQISYQPNVPLV